MSTSSPIEMRAERAASEVYDRASLSGDYMVMIAGQTEEDYYRCAPESRYCEYLDGIVYMPSPVSHRHQAFVLFLASLFDGFRWERSTGTVCMGPAVLRLRAGRNVEPDVFVLPDGAARPPGDALFNSEAVLVVEILSPSNRSHDLELKASMYRDESNPEVLFVDDRDQVLIVDRRVGDTYQRERITEGIWRSHALPGFWIDTAWLWADPLPNPRRCLETILAGPPLP